MTVQSTSEGPSKVAAGKECLIFSGDDADEVMHAAWNEAERRGGHSEFTPASGPVRDGTGTFVLHARMPYRQPHEVFGEFLNTLSGHFR